MMERLTFQLHQQGETRKSTKLFQTTLPKGTEKDFNLKHTRTKSRRKFKTLYDMF